MLLSVFLENLATFLKAQCLGAPLLVKCKRCSVKVANINRSVDRRRHPTGCIVWDSYVGLCRHHPIVKFVVKSVLLRLCLEHRNLACAKEAEHCTERIAVSVNEDSVFVFRQAMPS